MFWFLFLMDVGSLPAPAHTGASRVFTLSMLKTSGRCALASVLTAEGPPGVTQHCSSREDAAVGNHHMGSCPCENLWQVGSEIFTLQQQRVGGKFHFQPNLLYLLALPCLKGGQWVACWDLLASAGTLYTTCGIKFKPRIYAKTFLDWFSREVHWVVS